MHHLGLTRSSCHREYLLHTPDAFVRTPLPGLSGGEAIVHAAPQMGAGFAMTTIEFQAGGRLQRGPVQRFAYVLSGEVQLQLPQSATAHNLGPGGFCYLPAEQAHTLVALSVGRVLLFEKVWSPSPLENTGPGALGWVIGRESEVPPAPLNGDSAVQVRCLLPPTQAFDFAVNTMTYAPGASLAQVEIHYMEHGLLMLEGGGIYRLGDHWHPVQTEDAIWMAPFCPQWFAALGKTPARYLIYKDLNRHVLG